MRWRHKIAKAVAELLIPEFAELAAQIDESTQALHVHLEAATSTLTAAGEPEGTLTPDDRAGLHALRSQLGAQYNPEPQL
ncbi:MAG TPA: hypothetical protein VGG84_10310 [Gemmatimonadaceae bacterium]|jgi:hypothetical protein